MLKTYTNLFILTMLLLIFSIKIVNANTVVCINSTSGEFCIELYDDIAPVTVANFLNYVNDGSYSNTLIHRSLPGFIVQGGGFSINEQMELITTPVNEAIKNEFQLSNIRGTVAMAKVGGDPDSATNQWFINLADNSANLDNQNGGFTVFGRVISNGMDVIDSIANLQRYNFGGVLSDTPTVNYSGGAEINQENFVSIKNIQQLIEDETTATFQNNYIIAAVDAGSLGVFDCKLKLTEISPSYQYKFELDLSLLKIVSANSKSQASFNPLTSLLTIPRLKLSDTNILSNVILQLTDSESYIFLLQSIDGQAY